MCTYKYLSSFEACINTATGKLKFTPIPQLNDPSEMFPVFDSNDVAESLQQLRTNGYSDEEFEWLQKQEMLLKKLAQESLAVVIPETKEAASSLVKISFYDQLEELNHRLQATNKLMMDRTGIFCVSDRFDSFPMWAHYGNNAKGYVVEFKGIDAAFPGDGTGVLDELGRVLYSDRRIGMTFAPTSHRNMFYSKLTDWSYERELRIVKSLAECERVKVDDQEVYIFQIDQKLVARIIVGWNAERKFEDELREHFMESSDIVIVRAKVVDGKVCA